MTGREIYITLAMRYVTNTDIIYSLPFSKRLGKFIKRYKESEIEGVGSRHWKLYGHPMSVIHCNYNCIDCWNRCMKEFVDNGEDRCDL